MTEVSTPSPESNPSATVARPSPVPPRRSWGGWLLALLLIAMMAAAGYFGYRSLWPQWQQQQQRLNDQSAQLQALEARLAAAWQSQQQALEQQLAELTAQQQQQLARLREQTEAYQQAVASVQAEIAALDLSQQSSWRILEARQLVERAGQALWVEQKVGVSVQLLRLAERHLQALNNPAHRAAREALAADIYLLENLPPDQTEVVTLRLSGMQNALSMANWYQRAPGFSPTTEQTDADDWWQGLQASAGQLLDQLVRVQYRETPVQPLLSDAYIDLLKQRTLLQLQIAQQAALSGRQRPYEAALQEALALLQALGGSDAVALQRAQTELDSLAQTVLRPELPEALAASAQLERLARQVSQE